MATNQNDQPIVIRDAASARLSIGIGSVILGAAAVFLTRGAWLLGIAGIALASFEFMSSRGRVEVQEHTVTLLAFTSARRIDVSEIAGVDPNLKGWLIRTPGLVLTSGERVPVRPFRSPAGGRTSTQAAARLAERIGVPAAAATPAFRMGWFARAFVMSVCFLFGGFVFLAGVAELVDGGDSSVVEALLTTACGAAVLTGGVFTARAQRKRAEDTAGERGCRVRVSRASRRRPRRAPTRRARP